MLRRQFFGASGWSVIVTGVTPLMPERFDPWNVERLSSSEVLHTRWVKLANSAGSLEVLDRRCLTVAAGTHPLFQGVRRAVVTGLPGEPSIEEKDGTLKLLADGLNLEFVGARLSRSARVLTVSLP